MTWMVKGHSTRMSSDKESDASRAQRQTVNGAPQERSGVERDNQRQGRGASMVVRSSEEMSYSNSETSHNLAQQL